MQRTSPPSQPKACRSRAKAAALSAVALLALGFACAGLTACGGSSDAAQQARSPSPREIETYNQHHAELLELVSCARRHGVPLPAPTANNRVNTQGIDLKSPRRKAAINACYQKVVKKAEGRERAEQAEHEAGPRRLSEEPTQTAGSGGGAVRREHQRLTEVVGCVRRHGIDLPEPDAHNNIDTQGVIRTKRQTDVLHACVRAIVNKTAAEGQAQAPAQQSGPRRLGEETPAG